MNKHLPNSHQKEKIVRLAKKDKSKLQGSTNRAFLLAEERRDNSKP